MASRNDGVQNTYYRDHLNGSRFMRNPGMTELTLIENIFLRRFRELCINRFRWEGLPESIDSRFVETILFEQALAVYCRYAPEIDTGETDMILRATPTGQMDYQDNPLAYVTFANLQYPSTPHDAEDVVPIWANTARVPDLDIVVYYARRLAEAERTVDINMKNARHNRIVTVPEEQRLTAVNLMRQVDSGESVIFGTDALEIGSYNVFDMGMDPDVIGKVQIAKNQIMNDCMTMLGIDNANQDKKERMVVSEVDANAEQVGVNRAIALSQRQLAVEKINAKFGTKITVSWHEEITADNGGKDGRENGKLHDGTTDRVETNV